MQSVYCNFNGRGAAVFKGFGYKESIHVDDREFRIHTGCDPERQRIITEVFENGRFIYSSESPYFTRNREEDSLDENYLKEITGDLHQKLIDEIQIIFHIQEKIKNLNDYLPHFRLGKILFSKNFFKEATTSFKRAIQLKPDFFRTYQWLGLSYLQIKEYDKALKICELALRERSDFPDLFNCAGVIYTHLRNYEQAKNVLQNAMEIKQNFPEAQFNLGVVLFLSTLEDIPADANIIIPVRLHRALDQFRSNEHYQNKHWQDLLHRVELTLQNSNKEQVQQTLLDLQVKLAVKDDPVSLAMDFFFLKFMFGGRSLDNEEIQYYERIIREEESKHSGYADYWNELGALHLIQCRDYFLKAMEEFEKATEINPNYEYAKQTLEMIRRSKKGFLILLRAILK